MSRLAAAASALALASFPAAATACPACMGKAINAPVAEAMNGAIFLLLGFIGFALSGIIAAGIVIVRRSQHPLPPHIQLAEMTGSDDRSSH